MTTSSLAPAIPRGVQAYIVLLRELDDDELVEELCFIRRLLESAYQETFDRSDARRQAAGARRMEEILNAERGARVIRWRSEAARR